MNVFINDVPLIIKKVSDKVYKHKYDLVLGADDEFTSKDLVGDVLVRDATSAFLDRLLRLMEVKKLKKLKTLTMMARKKSNLILHLKDQFKIAKAAGGLVVKDGQVLMIYRLGKWDLPKGKLKSDEDVALGAMREVEEECNIKVELGEKLPSTWHSYAYKGNKMLKKTSWFVMKCLDDSVMRPQTEEYIEEVRWMSPQDALARLEESYASITVGGLLMAAGQFLLFGAGNIYGTPGSHWLLYAGLGTMIVGNGFFKPNISSMVGSLYSHGDTRKDAAYTIFYMGINLGSFIGNTVTSLIGDTGHPADFRWAFLACGIAMLLGTGIFNWGKGKYLHTPEGVPVGEKKRKNPRRAGWGLVKLRTLCGNDHAGPWPHATA